MHGSTLRLLQARGDLSADKQPRPCGRLRLDICAWLGLDICGWPGRLGRRESMQTSWGLLVNKCQISWIFINISLMFSYWPWAIGCWLAPWHRRSPTAAPRSNVQLATETPRWGAQPWFHLVPALCKWTARNVQKNRAWRRTSMIGALAIFSQLSLEQPFMLFKGPHGTPEAPKWHQDSYNP